MKEVGIITEAGGGVGYGHLFRSVAVAESFDDKGFKVNFYCNSDASELIKKKLPDADVRTWGYLSKNHQSEDFLIIDVFKDSFSRFKELVESTLDTVTVTVIDYLFREKALNSDIVFLIGYQNYDLKIELSIDEQGKNTWIYSGRKLLIFRKEFKNARSLDVREKAENVLVSMGGGDPAELTEFVFHSLSHMASGFNITCLVGGGFGDKRLSKLKDWSSDLPHAVNFLKQVDNFSEILPEYDLAIINGGGTRFELASLGVPFISIAINEQQKRISDKVAEDGIGISIGEYYNLNPGEVADRIDELLHDYQQRKKMSDGMKARVNAANSFGIIPELLQQDFTFRKIKDEELEEAYQVHCNVVDDLLNKGIRQWLRPIDFEKLQIRQERKENFGFFINNKLKAFLSLIKRTDYHEWEEDMPSHSTTWLNTLSVDVNDKIKGLGKVAVQMVFDHLREKGFKALYLDCVISESNFLVEYYKAQGFNELKQKRVQYRSGTFDVALMKKEL